MSVPSPVRPRPALAILHVAGLIAANHVWTRWIGASADAATIPPLLPGPLWLAIAQGGLEELVFRGVLFSWIRPRWGSLVAVLAPAMLFGAVHGEALQGTIALLLGIQLGVIRLAHGLPLAVAAHVANNAAVVLLASFSVRPDDAGVLLVIATLVAGSAAAALTQAVRNARPDATPIGGRDPTRHGGDAAGLQARARADD